MRRRKPSDYPDQVITKRGIVELHLSPAAMHEFMRRDLALPPDQILRIAREQMTEHPRRETFWQLVAYNALSEEQR